MNNVKAFEASTVQDLSNGVMGAQFGVVRPSNQGYEHSQLQHECNSQSGSGLGVIRLHPLHSPSFVIVCFTPKHTFAVMGYWTSLLIVNLMLRL